MFVFNNLMEIGEWLEKQAQALSGKAVNEKGAKLQYTRGQMYELSNLAALIKGKSIVIKEPEKPAVQEVRIIEDKKSDAKPSAANNDFLRWVRQNYSVRLYQSACADMCEGKTEDQIRRMLSGDTNNAE
jgi:hypothetical protein